ncbi:hypothetical protein J2Y58_001392 [Sphingomonas sp. BE138]|uniref:hypothetical protein n=1 Tax=Sphingomonas sp. BE138 TaxID=2817845 RepID=UPI002863A187|nr:hypothetical protein [Sphingomonas sp. BE138]MDR6788034.1 hypothetical protein [Sphingomonas sp. BE138]
MLSTRENRPQKLAEWQRRMDGVRIDVSRDRGALWSGIGADTARRLAASLQFITLEMTPIGASLDHGPLKDELIRDFGDQWIAEKRLIFRTLSRKFVAGLSGHVTVFLPDVLVRPRDGAAGSFAYAVKIIWDELKDADFGDPRVAAHRITSMRVCRVRGEQIVSDTIMSSSNRVH